LLPENKKIVFSIFEARVKKLEATHNRVRKFSLFTSRILRILESDSRNYLLY